MKILSQSPVNTLLENQCPFCKDYRTLMVKTKEFKAWQEGALIQNAMPTATPSEREFLITGICDDCWPKED